VLFIYIRFSFIVLSYPIINVLSEIETEPKIIKKKFYTLSIFCGRFYFSNINFTSHKIINWGQFGLQDANSPIIEELIFLHDFINIILVFITTFPGFIIIIIFIIIVGCDICGRKDCSGCRPPKGSWPFPWPGYPNPPLPPKEKIEGEISSKE